MEVKHYGQAETAGIRELLLDLHDGEYAGSDDAFHSRDRFAQFVDSWSGKEGFACVVGYEEQEPVGFAYGAPFAAGRWWKGSDLPTGYTGPSFALSELMVLPGWRKTGVAARLHDALLGRRTEPRATLLVDVTHPRVQALYESWGYEKIGEQKPFADSPVFAVMVRPLSRPQAEGARAGKRGG
ncbi:GNAT family N-acetyltransferase [Streptomyces synnematoformans]|uniref:N-acetyltransferase domain-containing protein n=1 Tax=Streptomyces synnematoformans TaxID=415721 RepID=A0ABN2YC67_9ACTN